MSLRIRTALQAESIFGDLWTRHEEIKYYNTHQILRTRYLALLTLEIPLRAWLIVRLEPFLHPLP